ncbi:MAG: hypothetical protein U0167_17690 [bacterium]
MSRSIPRFEEGRSGGAPVDAPGGGAATLRAVGTLRATLLAFGPLAIAALLTWVAARVDARPFDDVLLLPPDPISPFRFALALGAAAVGYFAVFFAPGLLVMRVLGLRLPNAPANALAAFVLSLLSVAGAWILAQAVTDGVGARTCLYLTVAVLDAAALLAAVALAPGTPALPRLADASRGSGRSELLVPAAGVILLIAACWMLMPGKITLESLEGDATEVHGFAASLFTHALPNWDLECGAWGFYPTFMFVAYPVFSSLALLGDTEAAVRLPGLLFLAVSVLATCDLAGRGRARAAGGSLRVLLPVLAAGYLSLQVGAYYAGYHPFHGDLACPALEEWAAAALTLCAVVMLRDGAPALAAVAAFLAILTFPSGLALAGLVGAGGLLALAAERRRVLRWGLLLAGLVAAYAIFFVVVAHAAGTLDATLREWWSKYFAGRGQFAAETPRRMLAALGWWALLAGGLPVAGVVLGLFASDRLSRWLALVTVLWTALCVLSPNKNIHYFLPVALLPIALSSRWLAGRAGALSTVVAPAALLLSVAGAIALCRPHPSPPYVADREFGRRTIVFASTEREAVDFSKVLFNVMEPLWKWKRGGPWVIGHHTWAMYADRGFDLARDYDFYVAEGPPPAPGLTEVTRLTGPNGRPVVFWARGGRAAVREWTRRTYPLRVEQSRFNFEMPEAR